MVSKCDILFGVENFLFTLIYLCYSNWEKGCYISGIRAGLSVCWSVRLVCRVVVCVVV